MFEDDESIIKCEIKLSRIFYPKNVKSVETGEYAIFAGTVVVPIENCCLDDIIKFKGNVPVLEYGTSYKVTASLADHHEIYGDTYEILYMSKKINISNKESQKELLNTILPEKTVENLFNTYDDIVSLLEKRNTEALCKVKGITESNVDRLYRAYDDTKDYSQIFVELSRSGLSGNLIKKITDYYKSPEKALDVIRKTPYELVTVDGIGFKKADEIALKMGVDKFDCQRIKGYLIHVLLEQAELGRSYLHYSELMKMLYDTLGFVPEEIVNKTAQMMIDDGKIHISENGENIGLTRYYNLEKDICNEIVRLMIGSSEDNVDTDKNSVPKYIPRDFNIFNPENVIAKVEDEQGFEFTDEQKSVIYTCLNNRVIAITGGAGCVDCDTEYFNGREWKKISDFTDGDRVLQYNADGTATLIYPLAYIKQKAEYLWHFETKYGLDQCLSDNHNCYYITSKGNLYHKTFKEVRENQETTGFKGRFITAFDYAGTGIPLTDDEIRIMVATFADGSFYYSNGDYKNISENIYNKARFHLKKSRKKARLLDLIEKLGYKYDISESSVKGYHDIYVKVPFRCKYFPLDWYNCNKEQLKIIADEIVYWDSYLKVKNRFTTVNKQDADFVQFVFTSLGYRATIACHDRVGENYLTADKIYTRKSIEYTVNWSKQNLIGMCADKRDDHTNTPITKYKTLDGFEYCFTVPSHMLVLRRNNKIFITGNCGKTSTANGICKIFKTHSIIAVALSGKAALRITEVTGLPASTIHKALGWFKGHFIHCKENPLEADIVLIDEATMINGSLFRDLLEAIPTGAKVIIMGDVQQLTPIGSCQVFADMLNSGVVPTVRLTKLHRQALNSGIIPTSIKVTNQEQLFSNTYQGSEIIGDLQDMELNITTEKCNLSDYVVEKFKQEYKKFKDINEVQVVSAMKTRGDLSCYNLNTKIQEVYNPISEDDIFIEIKLSEKKGKTTDTSSVKKYRIKAGDKVINTKNNYTCTDLDGNVCPVFNGNIGTVTNVTQNGVTIDFIGIGEVWFGRDKFKNLELGYCITTHKSQGSGFKSTIIALDGSSYIMNTAELLYTAITRAKKYCILVATNSAVRSAISHKEVNNKQTYLKDMLINNEDLKGDSTNE